MRIEAAYCEADPVKTLSDLLSWHINNASESRGEGLTDEAVFALAEQYGWTRKGDAGQWIVCHTNAAANLPRLVRAAAQQNGADHHG